MDNYIYEEVDEEIKNRLKNLNEGDLSYTYEEDAEWITTNEVSYFMYRFLPMLLKSLDAEDLDPKDFENYVKEEVDFYLKLHY